MSVTFETINSEEYKITTLTSGATIRELVRAEVVSQEPPTQMSGLAFMQLVGDANMVQLLTLAKTDPVCELLVKKIDRASVIDFDDLEWGPQVGMQYLLAIGALTQSEYDRILRREYL